MLNDISSLQTWKDKHIIVLGDVMLDQYEHGGVTRVNPESPATVILDSEVVTHALGGAANVAHNLKTLGARVTVYGLVGDDFYGPLLQNLLQEKGITSHLYCDRKKTTVKRRFFEISHNHQLLRVDYETRQPIADHLIPQVTDHFQRSIQEADAVIFSDYAKGFFRDGFTQSLLTLSHQYHLPALVDTKPKNFAHFRGATVLKPNLAEAQAMTHVHLGPDQDIFHDQFAHTLCRTLRELGNIDYAFITCGGKGMIGINKHDEVSFAPTKPVESFNLIGAGDTVMAALALGFTTDYDHGKGAIHMKRLMEIANLAAGVVVQKTGTSTVTLEELIQTVARHEQEKAI